MKLSEQIEARRAAMDSAGMGRKEFTVSAADVVDEERHVIRVKFAAFGNRDSVKDYLIKGCFAKSISERGPESATNRKIVFLWQHNMADPIGKVLKIEELDDGAYADVQLSNFDAVPNAKRAWYQLKDGDINQFSFGYKYIWDKMEYDEELDAFVIKELQLHEISVVTLGCNERTEYIGAVKSLESLYASATDEEKYNIKRHILAIFDEAEPAKPLTSKSSMFAKLGKSIN